MTGNLPFPVSAQNPIDGIIRPFALEPFALQEVALLAEARLFQNPAGGGVARIDRGGDAVQGESGEGIGEECGERFGGIAQVPMGAGDGIDAASDAVQRFFFEDFESKIASGCDDVPTGWPMIFRTCSSSA